VIRLVFMGTPDFAVASLEACLQFEQGQVVGVFTQPDRPKGRGNRLSPPPVKVAAETASIPVYQPEKIRSAEAIQVLRGLQPDLIVVVAYGQILPKEILEMPQYGCINVHASLLPKLRGASPIQWSIVSGETATGVTTMKMSEGLDEGDMLIQRGLQLSDSVTGRELHDQLMGIGAEVLIETLEACLANQLHPITQDHAQATYAPKIDKKMAEIDWQRTAKEISAQIRGFDPWPAGVTTLGEHKLKLFKPQVLAWPQDEWEPGVIVDVGRDSFVVKAGLDAVKITEIQAPGSRRMKVSEYLLGHRLSIGERLG
jgi:methionyl-tRNA formyltransferase